jgi:TonB family protein
MTTAVRARPRRHAALCLVFVIAAASGAACASTGPRAGAPCTWRDGRRVALDDPSFGAGTIRPGEGAVEPLVLREVPPKYTAAAMKAKLEGTVTLQLVVLSTGLVGDIRVIDSLDATLGLDNQAVCAASQWRFRPATFDGAVVPFLATLTFTFDLK